MGVCGTCEGVVVVVFFLSHTRTDGQTDRHGRVCTKRRQSQRQRGKRCVFALEAFQREIQRVTGLKSHPPAAVLPPLIHTHTHTLPACLRWDHRPPKLKQTLSRRSHTRHCKPAPSTFVTDSPPPPNTLSGYFLSVVFCQFTVTIVTFN